jgi:hypothetical protein
VTTVFSGLSRCTHSKTRKEKRNQQRCDKPRSIVLTERRVKPEKIGGREIRMIDAPHRTRPSNNRHVNFHLRCIDGIMKFLELSVMQLVKLCDQFNSTFSAFFLFCL